MFLLRLIWAVVHALFAKRADLVAENLALRQQLNVLRRKVGRPRLGSWAGDDVRRLLVTADQQAPAAIRERYGRPTMVKRTIRGRLYDYPHYYDLVFSLSREEVDFLKACFEKHARCRVRRLFEPACGTGRLLVRFAECGFEVSGNDLNPRAVEYCNARFRRRGLPATAVVGDMADFHLPRRANAAFNMINSFRHLLSEESAESHLNSVASNLTKGGLYVLGLHLLPSRGRRSVREKWSSRRGRLSVVSRMWSKRLDSRKREEICGMAFDISTPRRQWRIEEELVFRTYTAMQMQRLLDKLPQLELAATYDFRLEASRPTAVVPESEDVVYVLRRR